MAARQPRRENYTDRFISPPSSPASMLARKEEVGSSKAQGAAREAIDGVAGAASSASVTAATGHDMAVSEFVARFDEAARKRLNRMKDKLKKLETQMEALEAEMSKASDFSQWD